MQLTTDQDYTIQIPDQAQSWVSHADTRAFRTDKVILGVAANAPGMPERETTVTFLGEYDSVQILIHQKASHSLILRWIWALSTALTILKTESSYFRQHPKVTEQTSSLWVTDTAKGMSYQEETMRKS